MKDNKGSILAVTLAFMLAFTFIGFGSIYFVMRQNEAAVERIKSNNAFWLAEAGLQKAIWAFKYHDCVDFYWEGTTAAQCGIQPVPCKISCTSCTACGPSSRKLSESI